MPSKQTAFRELDDASLVRALADTKEELFNLRFQHVTGQLDNNSRLRQVRRDVARINTELRAREIAAAEALDTERENA
ncbi:MAG: 50S ribosomal protein L29 [Acidimicrobiales bacterium]|nr:50S ribosomal protein L29 [Acidimicrobiales bacterium]